MSAPACFAGPRQARLYPAGSIPALAGPAGTGMGPAGSAGTVAVAAAARGGPPALGSPPAAAVAAAAPDEARRLAAGSRTWCSSPRFRGAATPAPPAPGTAALTA
jgi:hypothetical protein